MTFVPHTTVDFKQSTLILPTVSIGNVPQLVTDLLIHTLKLQRVGCIDTTAVYPISSRREDGIVGVTVPIEVFQSKNKQWTCIQQRSPCIRGKKNEYTDEISNFIRQSSFKQVIIMSTMDATCRLDSQINSVPFRVHGSLSAGTDLVLEDHKELPGSGLACHLYEQLKTIVDTSLIIMFVLEGDNAQDSMTYAQFMAQLLKIDIDTPWNAPPSWDYLFGTPFNASLYQ